MEIKEVDPNTLKPWERNPKTHTKEQVNQLFRSIDQFGWTQPIVVDENLRVLCGHGRLEAALKRGDATVPVTQVTRLEELDKIALTILDNDIQRRTGFDEKKMNAVFAELGQSGFPVGEFGLTPTVLGSTTERETDHDTTAEAKQTYENNETKQIVLYFTSEEFKEISERFEKVMAQLNTTNKGKALMDMLDFYNAGLTL